MVPEKLRGIAAVEQIEQARQAIADAEEQLMMAKVRMETAVTNLAMIVEDSKSQTSEAVGWLYWWNLDISTDVIAEAFGIRQYDVYQMSGPATTTFACRQCGANLKITSRSKLYELERAQRDGGSLSAFYCPNCWQERQARIDAEHEARIAQIHDRVRQLKSMPYREYLQTPEWQARRQQQLRSAGFRCQVCNTQGVTLNVHHRTYERRGNENYKDLLVLCQGCHELFHRQGRLYEGE